MTISSFQSTFAALTNWWLRLNRTNNSPAHYRILKAEDCEVPVPFNTALAETGDLAAWARDFTGFMRAFTEPIVAVAFRRPQSDILDAIFQRVEARYLAAPTALRISLHFRQHCCSGFRNTCYSTLAFSMDSYAGPIIPGGPCAGRQVALRPTAVAPRGRFCRSH